MHIRYKEIWEELYSIIDHTWPEISMNIHAEQAGQLDWTKFLQTFQHAEKKKLKPPYVVTAVEREKEDPKWGLSNFAYRISIDLFYIVSSSEHSVPLHQVETKLDGFRHALLQWDSKNFMIIEAPRLDCNELLSANAFFTKHRLPFFAGRICMELLTGDSA